MKKAWRDDNTLLREDTYLGNKLERRLGEEPYCQVEDVFPDFKRSLTNKINKEYERMNKFPSLYPAALELRSLKYDEKTRTLTMNVTMGFKTYGDSYSTEETWKGVRSDRKPNIFKFDKSLSHPEANVIFPLPLLKCDQYYPTAYFLYHDKVFEFGDDEEMQFVDYVIVNVIKEYD